MSWSTPSSAYFTIFSKQVSGSPTMIMSASENHLGSNLPSIWRLSKGNIFSLSSSERWGTSHSKMNSARFLYHHHTESQIPLASACSIESAQCTSVYAATLLVVTSVSGVGFLAPSRYWRMCSAILVIGCMIENDNSPIPNFPATAADPSEVAAIHAGGWGTCTGLGVTMRRGKGGDFSG